MTQHISNKTLLLVVCSWLICQISLAQNTPSPNVLEKDDKDDKENYLLILQTSQEPSDNFVNEPGFSFEVNKEKTQFFIDYAFSYDPHEPEGDIKTSTPLFSEYSNHTRHIHRVHQSHVDVSFDLNRGNRLYLNNYFSYRDYNSIENLKNNSTQRNQWHNKKSNLFNLSQIWEHQINPSNRFDIGLIEIFKDSKYDINLHQNNQDFYQYIKTNSPLVSAFTQYQNSNRLGRFTAKLNYQFNDFKASKMEEIWISNPISDFGYREQVADIELAQRFITDSLSYFKISAGIENTDLTQHHNQTNFDKTLTHLLYQLRYHWENNFGTKTDLSFTKAIHRPSFKQLTPYYSFFDNHLFYKGNAFLNPEKQYRLRLKNRHKYWSISLETGYIKDKISELLKRDNHQISYENINIRETYFGGVKIEFEKEIIKNIWTTRFMGQSKYTYLKDTRYQPNNTTPNTEFLNHHRFDFGKNWHFELDYDYYLTTKNGFIKRHNYSKFDIALHKQFNDQLSISLYAEDLFKTNRHWIENTSSDFDYNAKIYIDLYTYGVSITYQLRGKNYHKNTRYQPKSKVKNRL